MRSLILSAAVVLLAATAAAQGTILAVYVNGTNLDTINPATGATLSSVTLTPTTGGLIGCTGIAQDPTTGTIYLAVRNTATQTDISLATVDKATGAVTKIGLFGEAVAGIQFNTAGQLYAVTGEAGSATTNPETLFTVNKATGAMTLFQALGNGDNGETIGFAPTNTAVMYHWSGMATQVYETVNLTTGATTPVVHSGVPANVTILCMAWDSNNQWFWTCTNLNAFGYIRPNGTYVQGFGNMVGQAKGMVVLPTIDPSVASLNLGSTTVGTASTPVNFNLSGYNLFGDVNIAAPSGVEVSLTAGSGYTNSLNVPRSSVSGQLNATQIFARITDTAAQGTITGVDLTLTATGGDTVLISLSGQVDPAPTPPEIEVRDAGNVLVADGGTDALGTLPITATQTVTYSILNTGDMDLVLSGTPLVALTAGANVQSLTLTIAPSTPITGANQTSFEVSFSIIAAGAFDFDISIDNNDSDENPYNWTVNGMGMAAPMFPEMDVLRGAAPIADGGTDTLPTQQIADIDVTYTINNTGAADLTITTPVTISGETNCTVTVTAQPANTVVAAGTTTLELTITPTVAGAFSFQISIVNNDANENPYDISVAGNVTAPPPPPDDDDDGEDEDDSGCSTGSNGWPALVAAAFAAAMFLRMRRMRA